VTAVPFAASIITLFPAVFPATLGLSVIGKALRENIWSLETIDLRGFGAGPHRQVDDTPAGGGPGMVLRADVAAAAIDAVPANGRPILYPSPRGAPLTQAMTRAWAEGPGLIVFCGRFEGLDERVIEARNMQEVCVGDAVLAGGEAAALVILEACVRLIPGVLGNEASPQDESFENGLLEEARYTRPGHSAQRRSRQDRAMETSRTRTDHAPAPAGLEKRLTLARFQPRLYFFGAA
jgi:tRNA (guanine37-N1)-methyltransferase